MSTSPLLFDAVPWNPIGPPELGGTERLIRKYWNSDSIGVCVLDAQLNFISVNEALARINGLPISGHVGKTLRQVVGELTDQIEPSVQRVFAEGRQIAPLQISGRRPNRTEKARWIDYFHPIKDETGRVSKVCIVVFEISEEHPLGEAFDDLQRRLNDESQRLRMLLDVNLLLASNSNLPQTFLKVSARIRRVLHHEYAALSLHDPATGLLVRHAIDFPLSKGMTAEVKIAAENSPSGRALLERTPKIFSKHELLSFEGETSERFLEEGLQTMCCVPLIRLTAALGVLTLGSTRQNAFTQRDVDLLEQVAAQFAIAIENRRAAQEMETLKDRLGAERKYLEGPFPLEGHFSEIIGESTTLKQVLGQVATVAPNQATVLILGETGTGKELIARAIHRMSRLKDGPFMKLNCAAIPTGLLESELFGHEKGAFTGAISQKIGRMELADGGSLFLDEIGEIPLELQPKLLRVLQDQEFERLGSNRTIRVKVRLISATNRDLAESVANHQFRSDLYYRLKVFPILVPPLRERREDVPLLVRYFVHKFSTRMARRIDSIPTETMEALVNWPWPGNIRELENLIERSVILSEGTVLRVPLLELRTVAARGAASTRPNTLDDAERQHIIRTLRETRGIISGPKGAARKLGLKRTTLQSKMQRLSIMRSDYTEPER
jgi:formate hydrogenlyase transcriptional activator